jgi:hypothetical protein
VHLLNKSIHHIERSGIKKLRGVLLQDRLKKQVQLGDIEPIIMPEIKGQLILSRLINSHLQVIDTLQEEDSRGITNLLAIGHLVLKELSKKLSKRKEVKRLELQEG